MSIRSRALFLILFSLSSGCGKSPPPVVAPPVVAPAPLVETKAPPVAVEPSPSPPAATPQTSVEPTVAPPPADSTPLRDWLSKYVHPDRAAPDEKAALELEKLEPQAPDIIPLLADPEAAVRQGATYYLLKILDPAARDQVAAMTTGLADADPIVRGFALSAIKQCRREDQLAALPRLKEMLSPTVETKKENRVSVIRLVGSFKGDAASARDSLIASASDDPEGEVRSAALVAVAGTVDAKTVLPLLTKALADKDTAVRLVAAARLKLLGSPAAAATKPLAGLLADGDVRVREAAAETLMTIGKPAVDDLAAQLAGNSLDARKLTLACFARIGPDAKSALPAIERCLSDADPQVRQLAEVAVRNMKGN